MAKIKVFLTTAVLTAALLGCTQLFEFNLFASMDKASVPKVSDLEKMDTGAALDLLEGEADSDAFFDALKGDPDGKAGLEGYLDGIMGGNGEPTEKQRAALLYSDIELKTTGADELVNNLVKVLDTSGSGGMDTFDSFGDFWDAVAPAGAVPGEVFDGLNNAYDGFDVLGGSLTDTNGDGTLDGPDGANMGEAAQNAVVSFVVYKVMTANGFTDGSELADALDSDTTLTMPDLSDSDPDFTNISNIVNAASPDLANLLGIQ